MGGVAIWGMHFIGNRAIILGEGQIQIQIAYSSTFTAFSFFLPVAVLFLAFWVVELNEIVSMTRIIIGSVLAGFGICGMHYLGQAGISNYECVYMVAYVIGAGAIAVSASGGALALFFLFWSSWSTTWWKRAVTANVLAVAVSGMHWLASVGTQYRLKSVDSSFNQFSSTSTVIVVIVLVCLNT
jgi:NO-binding membrane sensor protein with MHYT domain